MHLSSTPQAHSATRFLLAILQNISIHDDDNRTMQNLFQSFYDNFLHLKSGNTVVQFQLHTYFVSINDAPVKLERSFFGQLTKLESFRKKYGIGQIQFSPELLLEDVSELSMHIRHATTLTNGAEYLHNLNNPRIQIQPSPSTDIHLPPYLQCLHTYLTTLAYLTKFLHAGLDTKSSHLPKLRLAIQQITSLSHDNPSTMLGLTRQPLHREELATFLLNTSILSITLARRIGTTLSHTASIGFTACLHDLDTTKHRDLAHTLRQLSALYQFDSLARIRIAHLAQLANPNGSLTSQLIGLTSDYMYLTTPTFQPHPQRPDEALRLLEAKSTGGTRGELLNLLAHTLGTYPIGSLVELSNGRIAVVLEIPADGRELDQPIIQLLNSGEDQFSADTRLDLSLEPEISVKRSLESENLNLNVSSFFLA
ncbi:MAG: hypothetical protein VYA34_02085 [Myxococcota bacterium]|nr:hypothetical protein [Myxococcota bacterium]